MQGHLRRVVVIEDNEAAARLMRRILEARSDCQVKIASNGASGIELIRSFRPDLIITDLMMPDVDGFTVINTMKTDPAFNHIPIVVVTAKELTVREREYLDSQVDLLLQKGSTIDEDFIEHLVSKFD
jgi:CheY-like chemotaxis protein